MLIKTLLVDVATNTWSSPTRVPPYFRIPRGSHNIDLHTALTMLGTLTLPNIFSAASPARYWAWLRYFLAPSDTDDFRIRMPFADLDPPQKGILSDDFGVAICTQFLFDRLGGFVEIFDGRRFVIQFPHLIRRSAPKAAKVGPTKSPDFVIKDRAGKWHVLECKGTQSGRGFRNRFLRTALAQKNSIQITGRLRGERLAAGIALSNEMDEQLSQLRTTDPDVEEPLIELGEKEEEEIEAATSRLSISRGLGIIGLDLMAAELSLPLSNEGDLPEDLLRPSEIAGRRRSRSIRADEAIRQIQARDLVTFRRQGQTFEGRSVSMPLPELGREAPFNFIEVRQGLSHEVLQFLGASGSASLEAVHQRPDTIYSGERPVVLQSDHRRAFLKYGDLMYAEVILRKR